MQIYKWILIFSTIWFPFGAFSQVGLDSTDVLFKAKLLTTSRLGLLSGQEALETIKNQNAVFLDSPSSNLFFIRVDFDQRKGSAVEILGNCSYYLALNEAKLKFYRLGGFDSNDVYEFFEDLTAEDYSIFDPEFSSSSELDFHCMIIYSGLSIKKRKRRGYTCFQNCSQSLFTNLISR